MHSDYCVQVPIMVNYGHLVCACLLKVLSSNVQLLNKRVKVYLSNVSVLA
uniref:Uncharacterized protein n=1 Tax=Arundo donax TaxID=35708 RepID=A0A0A8XTZ2_ARUDO